jgi:GT2 family glycosyltransferase
LADNESMPDLSLYWRTFMKRSPSERAHLLRTAWLWLRTEGPLATVRRLTHGARRVNERDASTDSYAEWCLRHTPDAQQLAAMSEAARRFAYRPLISIITPVYNTEPRWLEPCARSVIEQAYDRWEWHIGNDGSTRPETIAALARIASLDPRIGVHALPANRGISAATNLALSHARGDYVALMDSDDALLPHALFRMVERLNERETPADVIYSDEDKLDLDGNRCEAYFKPDWSPEHFLSNMYVCHLLMARRELVVEVGGFRSAFDFSQDYDVMLRLMERARRIDHLSDIVYHWRKVPTSGAAAGDAKPPAHVAGRRALQDYLERNHIAGEIVDAGTPGFYRARCRIEGRPVVSVVGGAPPALDRAAAVAGVGIERVPSPEPATGAFLLFGLDRLEWADDAWLLALLEPAQLPGVAAVAPMLVGEDGRIREAGFTLDPQHLVRTPLSGCDPADGGYFGSTLVLRNVAAAGAAGLLVRRDAFAQVNGFAPALRGPDARAIDLCLRLRDAGYRVVHTPWARLVDRRPVRSEAPIGSEDAALLRSTWAAAFEGDPYHSRHLATEAFNRVRV